MQIDLRNGMVERNKCTRDNSNVHNIPEISHECARMEDKTLVQNLNTKQD